MPAADNVIDYAARLVRATRPTDEEAPEFVRKWVRWGAGPRAGQALLLGAKARALLDGRTVVAFEDIEAVASPVLRHRVLVNFQAEADGDRFGRDRSPAARRRAPLMLDPAVLATLADLELVSRVVVDGTVSGAHRSPFHGYSAEFSQYRHYRPGDDLKYVDWKLFARTDRLYTKQFRETTNLHCQIAIDTSRSMAYAAENGVSKLHYARMIAASLAQLLFRQGDAVGVVAYADRIRDYLPSRGGQLHLRALLLALARTEPDGETRAAAALGRAVDMMRRRGLIVVISDLYDEDEEVERVAAAGGARRARGGGLSSPHARRNRAAVQR